MKGVEFAIFANDVCGSPIPPLISAPWNYFDGRIFHRKLAIATQDGTNLVQICEGHVECVARVEHMRQAILEGCPFPLAKLPYTQPLFQNAHAHQNIIHQPPYIPRGVSNKPAAYFQGQPPPPNHAQYANHNYTRAQLKVAGYTVGNWGSVGVNRDLFLHTPALGGYQSFDAPLPNMRGFKNHNRNGNRGPANQNVRSSDQTRGMAYRGAGDGHLSLEAQRMRPFYLD